MTLWLRMVSLFLIAIFMFSQNIEVPVDCETTILLKDILHTWMTGVGPYQAIDKPLTKNENCPSENERCLYFEKKDICIIEIKLKSQQNHIYFNTPSAICKLSST